MGTLPESDQAVSAEPDNATETKDEKKATTPRKARGRVYINEERCKGCGLCIAFCPSHVLERSERFNTKGYHPPEDVHPENCTGCDMCGYFCPDFAIFGVRYKDLEKQTTPAAP